MNQEIRKLEIDFDEGILRINGSDIKERVLAHLPSDDGWELHKLFNPAASEKTAYDIRVTATHND